MRDLFVFQTLTAWSFYLQLVQPEFQTKIKDNEDCQKLMGFLDQMLLAEKPIPLAPVKTLLLDVLKISWISCPEGFFELKGDSIIFQDLWKQERKVLTPEEIYSFYSGISISYHLYRGTIPDSLGKEIPSGSIRSQSEVLEELRIQASGSR